MEARKKDPIAEVIPFTNGMIEYYYYTEEEEIDSITYSVRCHLIEKALEMAVCRQKEINFLLFLETDEMKMFKSWWPFLKWPGITIFFSIVRHDFSAGRNGSNF